MFIDIKKVGGKKITNIMTKKNLGFTLIELLVVIAIIGTLSGVVFTYLKGTRSSARDAIRQADMRQLVSAQGIYFGFNDSYFVGETPLQGGTPPIDRYLPLLHDPMCPGDECVADYTWVANTRDVTCAAPELGYFPEGDWFCSYATLEEEPSTVGNTVYFCSSQRGTKKVELSAPPSVDDDCTCL